MTKCICENCYNLKEEMVDGELLQSCEYGFPDETCETCESGECEFTCEHQQPITEFTVACSVCGKEMHVMTQSEDGVFYCPDCYWKQNS